MSEPILKRQNLKKAQEIVEDFDEEREELNLRIQLRQKIKPSETLEKDFTKHYKKQIKGEMETMIKERREKILEQYVHNYQEL